MIPKKRTRPKMNVRQSEVIRCPQHLAFVRSRECCINNAECDVSIEAAHVRIGTDGGTSLKPSDCWAIPLCYAHHAAQHRMGEISFERRFNINMKSIAEQLWAASPAGKRWRARHEHESQAEPPQGPIPESP